MNRRQFLKVSGGAALGTLLLTAAQWCDAPADNSQKNAKTKTSDKTKKSRTDKGHRYNDGKPRKSTLTPTHDDGKRYKCTHPSHRRPFLMFGTAQEVKHVIAHPSHEPFIVRY